MERRNANYLLKCAEIFQNHPILNIHFNSELSDLTGNSRKSENVCEKCFRNSDLHPPIIKTKSHKKFHENKKLIRNYKALVASCSLCHHNFKKVILKKRKKIVQENNHSDLVNVDLINIKKKKKKRNKKELNAGLIIPPSVISSQNSNDKILSSTTSTIKIPPTTNKPQLNKAKLAQLLHKTTKDSSTESRHDKLKKLLLNNSF